MARYCVICGRLIKTGHKYCYLHRSFAGHLKVTARERIIQILERSDRKKKTIKKRLNIMFK